MRSGALSCLLLLAGCSDLPAFYDSGVDRIVFEVDYMPGAEPETGSHGGVDDVWRIAADNTRAVLGDDKDYVFPHRLADMSMIEGVAPGELTREDILDIADAHRDEWDAPGVRTVYLVWLDGVFVDGGERREHVGAVSIDDTRVVAVFKPAVRSDASKVEEKRRGLVEQIVIVHELGHAYGLVDRGVPREESNVLVGYDDRDGHHCHNAGCVMNAGAGASHVSLVQANDFVLFGEECLADARRAR